MMQNKEVQAVYDCSYTDFIALVNQTNVPPGAYTTLTEWTLAGNVDADSHVVEVACTTGFSLREIAGQTGCSGEGVDLSEASIRRAVISASNDARRPRIHFTTGDALEFVPKHQPTHVIVGAALGFFPRPELMLDQVKSYFRTGHGLILASPFYCVKEMPSNLIADAQRVLGITPTLTDYKATMAIYRQFKIVFENRRDLIMETDDEIKHYCRSTIDRASSLSAQKDNEVLDAMYRRLFKIRDVTNRLRPYQGYSVLVLSHDHSDHGARYVELF